MEKQIKIKNGVHYIYSTQLKTFNDNDIELNSYKHVDFKDKTVLDIGACIGSFSRLAFEGNCSKYIAFEPDEDNFNMLKLNNKNLNSEIFLGAISNCDDEYIKFYKAESDNKTIGYTESNSTIDNIKSNRIEQLVKNYNFKKVLDKYKPQIIKCDIEGGEFDLFCDYLPNYVTEVIIEFHVLNKKENLYKLWFEIFNKTFLGQKWQIVKQPKYVCRNWTTFNGLNVFTIGFKRESNWLELDKKAKYKTLDKIINRKYSGINGHELDSIINKYCENQNRLSNKNKSFIEYSLLEYKSIKQLL
jgi:FkbM family methyltransferase